MADAPRDPLADLRRANADLAAARRAALNLMEDAILARDALRASEGRLRAVAENLPSGAAFVVGPDLRYLLAAGQALGPAGLTPAALEGKTVAEALPPGIVAEYEANYRRALAGESFRAEHAAHGRHYVTHGVPLRDAAGAVTAALAVSYDITDRKRAEDELRIARARLEERVAERTAELTGAVEALEAEMARRQKLAHRLATAQEDERKRVSRDLHDTVGQTHAALAMALRAAAAAVPPGSEAAEKLAYAAGLAEAMGRELHDAAVRLRPTALDDIGLGSAVTGLVTAWAARSGVAAECDVTGLDAARLPAGVETALYRVVQEALTNVARHARAAAVSVTVGRYAGEARAVVEDDGVGFDADAATARLGLAGMRERVELAGGTLEVESAPGAGTTVIARVPAPG